MGANSATSGTVIAEVKKKARHIRSLGESITTKRPFKRERENEKNFRRMLW